MDWLRSIIYGVVQGIAEFLPISSSGHLAALHNVFGLENIEDTGALLFDVLLHLGTLLAVVLVYYKDIWDLIRGLFSIIKKIFSGKFKYKELDTNEKFVIILIIACIPLIVGAFLDGAVEAVRNYTFAIGIFWIINGLILLISERIGKKNKDKDASKVDPKNAFIVGLYQLVAIFPGISRSGMTITGGLLNGFEREFAVKFSFILSIPAIIGANIFTLFKLGEDPIPDGMLPIYLVGMFAALVAGFLAIKLLQYISKKSKFVYFSYYCFAIGALAIIYDLFIKAPVLI